MIEINLLPGARRKARRAGPSFDLAGSLASVRERVRQPWLIGSVAIAIVAFAAVALLYVQQTRREAKINEALEKAVQDSTRFASVLREREKAEARRDTVLRALNLIRAIDDDRFIWPHIMDEVSHALPPYTWLVSLGYSGLGQAQTAIQTLAPLAANDSGSKKKRKPLGTVVLRDTIRLRVVGNTVDIQALTRFMKQLESSPFLEQVQLAKSERSNDNGKEVTQFQLDMLYTRPDPSMVKRVPLAVSVK
ncbi:MAG TPA: PilN domain-containing protein [Gemmatimonadaceae bacterium]